MNRRFIGLMAGTSLDAIDAALVCEQSGRIAVEGTHSRPISQALRLRLAGAGGDTRLADIVELDKAVATEFAAAARGLLANVGDPPSAITAIGSHGQTVWHRCGAPDAATVQIGDPNRIAEATGIPVVADFRRRDIAAGGEGAPLAPAFHLAMLPYACEPSAVLNLGGIANLTLPRGTEPLGFDCGPANTLMDRWVSRHLGQGYDTDGHWASSGQCLPELLQALASDAFFDQPPPKSTGPEHFNPQWLDAHLARLPQTPPPADVQATLAELTAISVADALARNEATPGRLIVCGGGVHNNYLMARLAAAAPDWRVTTSHELGIDPDYVEAAAFAWLAARRIDGLPGNLPSVTGAARPVTLGGIYPGG